MEKKFKNCQTLYNTSTRLLRSNIGKIVTCIKTPNCPLIRGPRPFTESGCGADRVATLPHAEELPQTILSRVTNVVRGVRSFEFTSNIIMSRIATVTELQGVLEDYKIHLTGQNSALERSEPLTTVSNPPDWPTDHRRVPDYRPVDSTRDAEGRPNGENAFERVFLTIMFTGVVMNAVSVNTTFWKVRKCD
jgi:hypothetical protein